MTQKRSRFVVSGRVQGVGFRWFVLEWAERLALSGWARNCEDDTLEAEAQGSPQALGEFARQLRIGPSGARVDAVEEIPLEHKPEAASFKIS
jgi:acylphosphatase